MGRYRIEAWSHFFGVVLTHIKDQHLFFSILNSLSAWWLKGVQHSLLTNVKWQSLSTGDKVHLEYLIHFRKAFTPSRGTGFSNWSLVWQPSENWFVKFVNLPLIIERLIFLLPNFGKYRIRLWASKMRPQIHYFFVHSFVLDKVVRYLMIVVDLLTC